MTTSLLHQFRAARLAVAILVAVQWLVAARAGAQEASAPLAVPQRIISLSPPITEVLFAIGAGPRVVGVTDFCTWPPEATMLPRCGGYINPSFERIVSLRPDLVVIQGEHPQAREFCVEQGVRFVAVPLEGIEGVLADIATLGEATCAGDGAARVVAEIRADLEILRNTLPPREDRPTVFATLPRSPGSLERIYTAGKGSFLDELLGLAGGTNVFGDIESLYPHISKESLLERQPEVILELMPETEATPEADARLRADWAVLAPLPAVRHGRIVILHDDMLLVPGPRLALSVAKLRLALYPGAILPPLRSVAPDGGGEAAAR